jgi:chorismate mutase
MTTTPELARLREDIERVDQEIVCLIAERMRLARAVGIAKHDAGLATLDHAREATVVRRAVELARAAGVSDVDEVRQIFWQLIGLCRRAQVEGR